MKGSQFFFINKDASSDSLSHSNKRERIKIHSHVQLGRKYHSQGQPKDGVIGGEVIVLSTKPGRRWSLSNQQLPKTAKSRSKLGRRNGSSDERGSPDSNGSSTGSQSSYAIDPAILHDHQHSTIDNTQSRLDIARLIHAHNDTIPAIPQHGDHLIDPFDVACVKMDSEVQRLLRYFCRENQPNSFHTESRLVDSRRQALQHRAEALVKGCFDNEVNMYTLLASMASQLRYLENFQGQRDSSPFISRAIVAIQAQIQSDNMVSERMVFNLFQLGCAEFFRFDVHAGLVHLKAAKMLIERLGGLRALDDRLMELVVLGDGYVAAELSQKPVFSATDFDPGDNQAMLRFGLETMQSLISGNCQIGTGLLAATQKHLVPPELRWIIMDLAVCLSVLQDQTESMTDMELKAFTLHWLHLRTLAIRHRLLALDLEDQRAHVIRMALIIWSFIVFTVGGRKRSSRIVSKNLYEILKTVPGQSWKNHEQVYLWTLMVGAMSSYSESLEQAWYIEEISKLRDNTLILDPQPDLTETGLKAFSSKFFYLDSKQDTMLRYVVERLDQLHIEREVLTYPSEIG